MNPLVRCFGNGFYLTTPPTPRRRESRNRTSSLHVNRRMLEFEGMDSLILLSGLDPATPFNFFIFGPMDEMNTDVEGRLAVGGPATLTNFGVNAIPGPANALVSGTSLTYTNGTIKGDLHYNDNSATLTGVAVTGTTYPNSTPIDFAAAKTSLTDYSGFLSTQTSTGAVSLSGSTLTLTGDPSNTLNIFNITTNELEATNNGRIDLTNVSPTSTIVINVSGTSANITNTDFQYNGVGGDQAIASRILYNFSQATSLHFQSASPLGSILAPLADVTSQNGAHISGTLIAESLSGTLEGHDYPFEGNPPPMESEGEADLLLTKSASTLTPSLNGTITFTITLTDLGPDPSQGVFVSDVLPPGITFVSATTSQGSYNHDTGVWDAGTVTVGQPATLTVVGTVTNCCPMVNTASIIGSETTDPNASNNTSSITITPIQTDLALSKTVDNSRPAVGDPDTFTIVITNNGPNATSGVVVADQLPTGLTFVSSTPSQGTYDPSTGQWTVGSLASGATATLQLHVTVSAPGNYVNDAAIVASDLPDCITTNNTAEVALTVNATPPPPAEADLALTKTASTLTPNLDGTVTYTVTITNLGPDTAQGVLVSDPVPAGITFVSATTTQGTYSSNTAIWDAGTVAVGQPVTLTVVGTVSNCCPIVNTASIVGTETPDPNPNNNTSSITITPIQTDLTLTKTVDNARPTIGDTVTFYVTVTNQGPNATTGVIVADPIPAGLLLSSSTASQGSYNPTTGQWAVGSLPLGASATLQLRVTTLVAAQIVNDAAVIASDLPECDPTNDMAQSTIDVQANTSVVVTPPTLDDVARYGYHNQPTTFVLTFSSPLDPARASDVSNYTLTQLIHGRFAGPVIPITSAVYNATTDAVTLSFPRKLKLRATYLLVVNGTTSTGIASPSGVLLDGLNNGVPGSNASWLVSGHSLAGPNPLLQPLRLASREIERTTHPLLRASAQHPTFKAPLSWRASATSAHHQGAAHGILARHSGR